MISGLVSKFFANKLVGDLIILQPLIKKYNLEKVSLLSYNTKGYIIADDQVVGIGLYGIKIDDSDKDILSNLKNLKEMSLAGCALSDISFLSKLNNIEVLDLNNNKIADIKALNNLIGLKCLYLSDNKITDIEALSNLIGLNALDLINTQITDIKALSNLINLNYLYLSDNKITDIKALSNLINLNYLYLINNQITDIKALSNLINLNELSLGDNQITDIKALSNLINLNKLSLNNNKITDIKALNNLINLNVLLLDDNPILSDISPEMIKGYDGIELVREILKLKSSTKNLNEFKLMVVGNGAVGKTSIINVFRNGECGDTTSTKGIDITKIDEHKQTFGNLTANIWDFAGQEVTHSTHKYFLNTRCIYMLVHSIRDEDNQKSSLENWLETISYLSKDAPIILVINKMDKVGYRKDSFDEYYYKDKYKNIYAVVYVSAYENNNINELIDVVKSCTTELSYIHSPITPNLSATKEWFEKQKINRTNIAINEYRQSFGAIPTDEQDKLLMTLNDIGTIVRYEDNIKHINILSPEWLTEGVYSIIRCTDIQNDGIFTSQMYDGMFSQNNKYKDDYEWFVKMLVYFDVAVKINDTILLPNRVSSTSPRKAYDSIYRVVYEYQRYDDTIIPTLIVKLYDMKQDDDSYWQNGIFVCYKDANAVVVADKRDKKISVIFEQNSREAKMLLAIIRVHFDKLHQDKNYGVIQNIPLVYNNEICAYKNYNVLLHNERKKITTIDEEATEGVNAGNMLSFDVRDTLDWCSMDMIYKKLLDISKLLVDGKKHNLITQKDENAITKEYYTHLSSMGYNVADQSTGGISGSGKSVGERDILIRGEHNTPQGVIEAIILNSFVTTKIDSHYEKLTKNYDPNKNKIAYMLVYVTGGNYNNIWEKYKAKYKDAVVLESYGATRSIVTSKETVQVYHIVIDFTLD